ncbi:hypothetical protein CEB3_c24960 [Peptococcaceae bacterium CEB3]|nr:hypothetical protein CEB3_c24960 [Peptococcaceae bacterium CEB3]
MVSTADEMFLDTEGWQAILDRRQEIFTDMLPGASLGILPKKNFDSPVGTMLTWVRQADRMEVAYQSFTGFENTSVDLLMVVDDETLEYLHSQAQDNAFNEMKEQIRNGNVLLYVMKTLDELLDLGYEELIEVLKIPVLGACR